MLLGDAPRPFPVKAQWYRRLLEDQITVCKITVDFRGHVRKGKV
jgi:hypothetical protein